MRSRAASLYQTSLYQNIISAIRGAFIEPAEKFGVSIVELKAFDPSIDELIDTQTFCSQL
jgi:hypothetical protein